MIEAEDVEEARERDGERGNVPNAAREALEEEEQLVGWRNGLPLLADSYDEYPQDVLSPDAAEFLSKAADAFGSTENLAEELRQTSSKVRKALELHDIEAPNGGSSFDLDQDPDVVAVPLIGEVDTDHLRSPVYSDDRLLTHLYVGCEYGVEDIAALLEVRMNRGNGDGSRWRVDPRDVRAELVEIGLVEERDDEGSTEFDDGGRGRLPSGSIGFKNEPSPGSGNPGTSINAEDIEAADGVHFG